ncbi:MAG: PemK family transcriptional regulator [Spirochaetes bacterium GWF1_41_5]|nr:MAG: PemK family transcriptional regulator [Spirochaetes bacterium GWF1_41_5]HBE00957.1 type II toxin-antitoxin system PemK/MazF family toxin [Spirochaetia bacterium]
MVILQGDIYWLHLSEPKGSEPGYSHPVVIISNDSFNISNINTVSVVLLTSNQKWANIIGNVRLLKGEGNLPKSCIANITQITTINKSELGEKIGKLSNSKIEEIIAGINFYIKRRII